MITFTNLPKRGDVCVGNLSTKEKLFIRLESLSALADIDQSKYEIQGVVTNREGKDVTIVHPSCRANNKWAARYSFALTGYTLDGTDRTGVLSICDSSSWSTYKDYTISYNASTVSELVAQLNAIFAADTIEYGGSQVANPFKAQDWFAQTGWNGADDTAITLHFNFADSKQTSNKGKSGFTLTANLMSDVIARAAIMRRSGYVGGAGAISSWYKALAYFRSDNSTADYNPSSTVTTTKKATPVCLPAYLGKSEYRKDGQGNYQDYCALLRSTYGEGEEGWLKFMESCLPVVPTDRGNMGMTDGLERTKILASHKYSSLTKTDQPLCPAANYCYQTATQCIPQGNWFMGTTKDVYRLLEGVKYSSHSSSRKSDPLNAALLLIGGSAVSNGSFYWSCLRLSASIAWSAIGNLGIFNYSGMYLSYVSVPLSLIRLA